MTSSPDNNSLLSDQNTNQFWCRWGLNSRSLIQPSETLPVELTETHDYPFVLSLLKPMNVGILWNKKKKSGPNRGNSLNNNIDKYNN